MALRLGPALAQVTATIRERAPQTVILDFWARDTRRGLARHVASPDSGRPQGKEQRTVAPELARRCTWARSGEAAAAGLSLGFDLARASAIGGHRAQRTAVRGAWVLAK